MRHTSNYNPVYIRIVFLETIKEIFVLYQKSILLYIKRCFCDILKVIFVIIQ